MGHERDQDGRPDPDALLREIERVDSPKGKLKVFLGYSPGVGKTYSMLMEARIRSRRGDDVVIGVVEAHGRSETEILLEGLEVIPRRTTEYNGIELDEMDLDAILGRRPELVLVDELAHSNAPWCRHPKRYLDVMELLRAGINVYTTLNVQHLESQNDVVTRITGIRMRETLPDWIIDEAEEIQLIDIPLEMLFDRLREGKVYIPQEAQRAMESFFQRGHLVALREIALNVVALKMDAELLDYRRARAIDAPWPAAERLMVCVGPTPDASELVRKTYRIAKERNAEWYAVHVAPPVVGELTAGQQANVANALNLADEFGAQTLTMSEPDVVPALLRFARENNISQIVVGKPRRSILSSALRGYPVYRLMREQGEFDLLLVSPVTPSGARTRERTRGPFQLRGYVAAVMVLAAASGLNLLIESYLDPTALYSIYLLATLVIALVFGVGPSIWTAILSFLAFDFLFVEPKYALSIKHPSDLVAAVVFLATSIAVGQLIQISRRQSAALRTRAGRSSLLEELAKAFLELPPRIDRPTSHWPGTSQARETALDRIAQVGTRYVAKAVSRPVVLLFGTPGEHLELRGWTDPKHALSNEVLAVAEWARDHREEAGAGTETLASTAYFFLPMVHDELAVGVIGIGGSADSLLPEERRVLRAIASVTALAAHHWLEGASARGRS